MASKVTVTSGNKNEDYVKTKYYCQVTEKQKVDVVMKLSTVESVMSTVIPSRFVLVIDVSGSMQEEIGDETLLDRVKTFARMVVENVSNTDWISIVTFSDDAQVDVELTKMTKDGKKKCLQVISAMNIRGRTNLESGIMQALDELKRVPSTNARDMVIIFTDGAVSDGEDDPDKLVTKYRDAQKEMRHDKCIPLSAFTIGNYVPDLLQQLSWYLGSEAFYWLNPNGEFEADMLMPIFLRKETRITDITIEMNCLNDVQFTELTTMESQKHLRESSEDRMTFFIHSIPRNVRRHTLVTMALPQDKVEELDGERILHVTVTYLNGVADTRRIDDYIEFHTKSIRNLKPANHKIHQGDGKMDEISAFYVSENVTRMTWAEAQNALVVIADEKSRCLTTKAMRDVTTQITNGDADSRRTILAEAINEISRIKQEYLTVVGDRGSTATQITSDADTWIEKLNYGEVMLNDAEWNAGKLYAMSSSVAAEMPTTRGIFDPKQTQTYMLDNVNANIQECEKKLKKAKKKKKKKKEKPTLARVFVGKTLLLSELLRHKKVGETQETMEEIIVKCGGKLDYMVIACPYEQKPRWYIQKTFPDTFLISSENDYSAKTFTVSEATRVQIPVLPEVFLFDCIKKKVFLDPALYAYPIT